MCVAKQHYKKPSFNDWGTIKIIREKPVRSQIGKILSAIVIAAFCVGAVRIVPVEAGLKLCGRDWAKPEDMLKQLVKVEKLPEVHRDQFYVAYQDTKTTTMWTFTLPGIPSHPAVVCRQPEKDGEMMKLHMDVNCNGDERACEALVKDFRLLNSQMAKAMNKKR